MSAPKKLHALRGEEPVSIVESRAAAEPAAAARPAGREGAVAAAAVAAEIDRRRLTVSERLAEGRGYWRGVATGGVMGLALGVAGAVITFSTWAPLIQDIARDYLILRDVINTP